MREVFKLMLRYMQYKVLSQWDRSFRNNWSPLGQRPTSFFCFLCSCCSGSWSFIHILFFIGVSLFHSIHSYFWAYHHFFVFVLHIVVILWPKVFRHGQVKLECSLNGFLEIGQYFLAHLLIWPFHKQSPVVGIAIL